MRTFLTYFKLELKRTLKSIPYFLAGAIVLVLLAGTIAFSASKMLYGDKALGKIIVGVVAVSYTHLVAGISCGLVTGDTDDDYIVLTDIQGLEDFFGDMDFKVGGTHKGITAIQMDIKIHGLTRPIIEEAIAKTREARIHILDDVMKPVIAEPRRCV